MKLIGVQNGGKQPPETKTDAPNDREESVNSTPREAPPQEYINTAEQHYNAAAALFDRHDKIVNKVKTGATRNGSHL